MADLGAIAQKQGYSKPALQNPNPQSVAPAQPSNPFQPQPAFPGVPPQYNQPAIQPPQPNTNAQSGGWGGTTTSSAHPSASAAPSSLQQQAEQQGLVKQSPLANVPISNNLTPDIPKPYGGTLVPTQNEALKMFGYTQTGRQTGQYGYNQVNTTIYQDETGREINRTSTTQFIPKPQPFFNFSSGEVEYRATYDNPIFSFGPTGYDPYSFQKNIEAENKIIYGESRYAALKQVAVPEIAALPPAARFEMPVSYQIAKEIPSIPFVTNTAKVVTGLATYNEQYSPVLPGVTGQQIANAGFGGLVVESAAMLAPNVALSSSRALGRVLGIRGFAPQYETTMLRGVLQTQKTTATEGAIGPAEFSRTTTLGEDVGLRSLARSDIIDVKTGAVRSVKDIVIQAQDNLAVIRSESLKPDVFKIVSAEKPVLQDTILTQAKTLTKMTESVGKAWRGQVIETQIASVPVEMPKPPAMSGELFKGGKSGGRPLYNAQAKAEQTIFEKLTGKKIDERFLIKPRSGEIPAVTNAIPSGKGSVVVSEGPVYTGPVKVKVAEQPIFTRRLPTRSVSSPYVYTALPPGESMPISAPSMITQPITQQIRIPKAVPAPTVIQTIGEGVRNEFKSVVNAKNAISSSLKLGSEAVGVNDMIKSAQNVKYEPVNIFQTEKDIAFRQDQPQIFKQATQQKTAEDLFKISTFPGGGFPAFPKFTLPSEGGPRNLNFIGIRTGKQPRGYTPSLSGILSGKSIPYSKKNVKNLLKMRFTGAEIRFPILRRGKR